MCCYQVLLARWCILQMGEQQIYDVFTLRGEGRETHWAGWGGRWIGCDLLLWSPAVRGARKQSHNDLSDRGQKGLGVKTSWWVCSRGIRQVNPSAPQPRHTSRQLKCRAAGRLDRMIFAEPERREYFFVNWFHPGSIMMCGGGGSDLNRSLKPTHSYAHHDWVPPVKTQPHSLSAPLCMSITAEASSFTSKWPIISGKWSISTPKETIRMLAFSPRVGPVVRPSKYVYIINIQWAIELRGDMGASSLLICN